MKEGVKKGVGPVYMIRLSHGHYRNIVLAIPSWMFINKYESKSRLSMKIVLSKFSLGGLTACVANIWGFLGVGRTGRRALLWGGVILPSVRPRQRRSLSGATAT